MIDKNSCDKEFLKIVQKEIQVWRALDHPNIIKFIDQFETMSAMFVFCELAEQGPLYDYVTESPGGYLCESEARRIFSQIISAIEYLHSHHILHGDIKLDNILLDRDYNVKLCDFGLSCLISPDTGLVTCFTSACGGTLLYSAPEVIQQQDKQIGTKADIWSAGVTLFAMVFGQMPFDDPFEPRLKHMIVTGAFHFPEDTDVSDNCKDLIKRMLTVSTKDRIDTSSVMDHFWLC